MRKDYYRLVFFYLSMFLVMIGAIQLLPLLVLPFYPSEISYASCFLIPGVITIIIGLITRWALRNTVILKLEKHYDSLLLVLIWLLAILISTIPWILKGDYNFTQAAFEMTSGFSTTGLSVVDVDHTPHIFLMFRSITLFVGGVGFVLIITSAFADKYGLNLYNAEGHNDRILPNIAKSARLILSFYSAYIAFGIIAYILCGMPVFDAINTAIAALSTGGFSVIGESIYGYHSLPIELITIILMIMGQTNFMLHLNFFSGRFKKFFNHCETKFFIILLAIFASFMTFNLMESGYTENILESLRISLFQFVTCITTTGFISVGDLRLLPPGFISIMVLMMLVGGNQESTGGGIKQYRVIIALKGIYYSIRESILNPRVITSHHITRFGEKYNLHNEEIRLTSSYILFYLILFLLGSTIFTLYGYSLQDAMFEFSSAISTVGLSVGITNYYASPVILWTAIIGMFLGRMEIIVVFKAIFRIEKDLKNREYLR